jgi:hypothetical protein
LKGRRLLPAALAMAGSLSLAPGAPVPEPASPLALLQGAFDRMFNYPSVRSVSLRIHRGDRVTERAFEVAYKQVGDERRTLLRFSDPPYLRGTTLLVLEVPGAGSDTWLYQPAWRRVRRVATSQKGDSFFGSDLSFEDLEHHDWSRWILRMLPAAEEQGQLCSRVEALPLDESHYGRIVAWIEPEQSALARVDFHRRADGPAQKSLVVSQKELALAGDVLLPGRIWFRQHGRDASTEVVFERVELDPEIADEIFSAARLEHTGRSLFGVVERLRGEP